MDLNLKYTQTTLLHLNWFYDILDLGLKGVPYWTQIGFMIYWTSTWKTVGLLGVGLLGLIKSIKQAGMSLEKYEYLLELSSEELVTQSSQISLDQIMCGVCVKNQTSC